MQSAETQPLRQPSSQISLEGTRYELRMPEKKPALGTLGTAVLDVFRDIDTANKMAAGKFEGDSALMEVARGFVTGAVGAGLEVASDQLWKAKWAGTEAIFPSAWFKVGNDINKKMLKLAKTHPRAYYFVKESTQDLAIGALYNFIAFRSQPLLSQAEPKHLLASLATNLGEATLQKDMDKRIAGEVHPQREADERDLEAKRDYLQTLVGQKRRGKFPTKTAETQYKKTKRDILKYEKKLGQDVAPNVIMVALKLSNPVTWKGVDMIWNGARTLVKNFVNVREVRKEKGGLPGKSVSMAKENKVYYGNSRGFNRRREEYERADDT